MLQSVPLRVSVLVICFLWTLPTAGLFVSSFRDPKLITQTGWWTALIHPFEQGWTLQNYQQVIGSNGMGEAFLNSLIVTIPATVIPITIAAFAAYALAWIPFRGRGILFTIVVALLVVPLQMALIPILQLYSGLGLYGTFIGIWLAHTAFGLPLAIFLLYNFMSRLPRDLFESASIDGASAFQTFTRSCCRSRSRHSAPSRSSSSCGSGTTCSWPSCSSGPGRTSGSCRRRCSTCSVPMAAHGTCSPRAPS